MIDAIPEIQPLLAEDRLNALGPGTPNLAQRPPLAQLEALITPKIKDRTFALACLAALWLRHDFFDESHAISQDLHTLEGSYWHGILHRREPDYGNAKYWFRRVPAHPIHAALREAVLQHCKVPAFISATRWEAAVFVDLCEQQAAPNAMAHDFCRRIQQIEWDMLFAYCHERAFAS